VEIAEKGFTTEDTGYTGEFGQKLLIARSQRSAVEIAEKSFTTEDTGLSSHGHLARPAKLSGHFFWERDSCRLIRYFLFMAGLGRFLMTWWMRI
jgi:hypothetical protein